MTNVEIIYKISYQPLPGPPLVKEKKDKTFRINQKKYCVISAYGALFKEKLNVLNAVKNKTEEKLKSSTNPAFVIAINRKTRRSFIVAIVVLVDISQHTFATIYIFNTRRGVAF